MKRFFVPILLVLFFSTEISAQDSIPFSDEKLVIGVTETAPFVSYENGRYTGLSITFWEMVNEELDVEYEYKDYPSLEALLSAVENAEVDFSINPITVTDQRMKRMDFSQPYFISHTGIAKKSGSKIWQYLANIVSWNFISAILILVGVIFIFGFLVWLFERRVNDEFGEGTRGIFQGFWWSAVTMTTVGYGDKSPRSFGGRMVGLIWMFMAIIMISSLTAGIASSLTVQNMSEQINSTQDLSKFEVTTVRSSSALELLNQYNVETAEVGNAAEGIERLLNDETSLFVYDQPILDYHIKQQELQDDLEVLQKTLKKDYYGFSFPNNSTLIRIIDPVLVSTLKTMEWNNLVQEYR